MKVLKNKLNSQEEFDALPESLREFYERQTGKDEWLLQTEEASTLKRALQTERRQHGDVVKLLAQVVPDIADSGERDGYIKREEWGAKVRAKADLLEELAEDEFDLAKWRDLRAAGDDGKKPSELKVQLTEAQTAIREKDREIKRLSGERDSAKTEKETAVNRAKTLAREHGLDSALDLAGVRDPKRRRVARLLLRERGIDVRETGDESAPFEVLVKDDAGGQVLLEEFATEWAESDEGKEYATAADSSGGGEGPEDARDVRRPTRERGEDWESLDPRQQIDFGYRSHGSKGQGARRPAAATR